MRVKQNCSYQEDYNMESRILSAQFKEKGNPEEIIGKTSDQTEQANCKEILICDRGQKKSKCFDVFV